MVRTLPANRKWCFVSMHFLHMIIYIHLSVYHMIPVLRQLLQHIVCECLKSFTSKFVGLSHVYPCIFSAFSHQQCDFRDVSDLNNFHGYPLVNLHSKLQEIPIFHREMCHLHSGSIFHVTFTERRRHLLTSHRSSPAEAVQHGVFRCSDRIVGERPGRKNRKKKSQLEGLITKL